MTATVQYILMRIHFSRKQSEALWIKGLLENKAVMATMQRQDFSNARGTTQRLSILTESTLWSIREAQRLISRFTCEKWLQMESSKATKMKTSVRIQDYQDLNQKVLPM